MPHVIVKLWPGNSPEQKQALSDAIAHEVSDKLGSGAHSISIAFEEVDPQDRTEQVFEPEILGKWDQLAREPRYGPQPPD